MSFSTEVKEELVKVQPHENHCRLAELSALFSYYARIETDTEMTVTLPDDNKYAFRKCFTLLTKTYNIDTAIFGESIDNPEFPVLLNKENSDIESILDSLSLKDPRKLLKKDCCKRAYLRGAFIASGFVGDPIGSYHFEVVSDDADHGRFISLLMSEFEVNSKLTVRKKHYVSYLKSVEDIADILNALGASRAMMEFINARIIKDVRNKINRRNNCDTANISKTVDASARQIEDIMLIRDRIGLDALPDNLRDIAKVRLDHPDSPLAELGSFLEPPVGKSGVNHRLRKISEYAAGLR